MMTGHEVSVLTGVSVRTLHHYDAIGLLKPAEVTSAGYRLYDDACLARLGRILIMKELMFPRRLRLRQRKRLPQRRHSRQNRRKRKPDMGASQRRKNSQGVPQWGTP